MIHLAGPAFGLIWNVMTSPSVLPSAAVCVRGHGEVELDLNKDSPSFFQR
jgi:hypothetical protein